MAPALSASSQFSTRRTYTFPLAFAIFSTASVFLGIGVVELLLQGWRRDRYLLGYCGYLLVMASLTALVATSKPEAPSEWWLAPAVIAGATSIVVLVANSLARGSTHVDLTQRPVPSTG